MKASHSIIAAVCAALTVISSFAADTPPAGVELVDLTGSGKGTASSMYASGWTDGSAATVFDNNFDNRSIYQKQTLDWRWTFNEPTVVNAYKMYSCKSTYWYYDQRMPKDWRFEGKNTADEEWTTLDTRSGETVLWAAKEGRYFQCDNKTAYDMYRVVSTATIEGNNGYTQIAELEFFHVVTGPRLSDAAFAKTSDGVYTFTATATKGSGTLSLVFSSDEADPVEIALGAFAEGDSISKQIVIAETDLRTDVFYTLQTVAANDDGTTRETLPGEYFFGTYATSDDALRFFTVTVPETFTKTLTDYVFPIRLSTDIAGFDYADFQQAGKDIIVKDLDRNELPCELAAWNPDGETVLWVKAKSLEAGSVFTVYYGFPRKAQNLSKTVWQGFAGVWHLDEADAAGVAKDATPNGLNGTPSAAMSSVAGSVGQARYTNKAALNVPNYDSLKLGGTFTVSGWFKLHSANSYPRYFCRKANYTDTNGWEAEMANGSKSKMSARGASSTSISITAPADMDKAWNLLTLVYDDKTLTAYVNGVQKATGAIAAATDNGRILTFAGSSLDADIDEFRLEDAVRSADAIAADYYFGTTALTYGEAKLHDATAIDFDAPTATVASDGAVTVTVPVVSGEGDVSVVYNEDESAKVALGTISATPCAFTHTPAVPTDTIWSFAAHGVNAKGTMTSRKAVSGVLNGVVSAAKVSDAKEDGLVPGKFTVSRPVAASACTYPLVVNLEWGGTAVAGKNFVDDLPTTVTIPEGESEVAITVTPLLDSASKRDETLTLKILSGQYLVGTAATMAIVNLVVPDGWNTWVATAAGKASEAANWSAGRVPEAGDRVLFDGRFSDAKCEWDETAPSEVASWMQSTNFTGTVTIATTFDSYKTAFTNFVVTGDVKVLGGKLSPQTHAKSLTSMYRLMMTVGGDFTVGKGAEVTAAGLGRYSNHGAWGGQASHGGDCVSGASTTVNTKYPAYGSIFEPVQPAYGSDSGTDADSKRSNGGGALYLLVGGDFTNEGLVSADGGKQYAAAGAGGSIYVAAANILGSGTYSATVLKQDKTDGTGANGAGGRIALVADGVNEATLAKIVCNGRREGWGSCGAPGTIYLKSAAGASVNVQGVQGYAGDIYAATTPIPALDDAGNWTKCARSVDLVGATCAHLRLTQPLAKMNALSLLSAASNGKSGNNVVYRQSDLDLAGKVLQVRSVIIDGIDLKLASGDYTLADATERGWGWLKDSSHKPAVEDNPETEDVDESSPEEPGTGILRIFRGGTTIIVR